jgi:cysteinyl-tRNA synthetase
MNDDLNTSKALGIVYELIKQGNEEDDVKIAASVKYYYSLLGFRYEVETVIEPYRDVMKILAEVEKRLASANRTELLNDIMVRFHDRIIGIRNVNELYPKIIALLLYVRNVLRKEKNYELADYIRKRLLENNIIIDDQSIDASTFRLEAK